LTDKYNEHSESAEDSLSFKNQILRDLQEATRLRSLREEEHKSALRLVSQTGRLKRRFNISVS